MMRLLRVWDNLDPEQRLAGAASLALFFTMFLPWYNKSVAETARNQPHSLTFGGHNLTAFGAFSFVEAAVLLVSAGVLVLLFARAERRSFHLPGSDGTVVAVAGLWTALLIFYRMLDRPGTIGNSQLTTTIGLQWGVFFALAAAGLLVYAGLRMRAANPPEPPLVRGRTRRRNAHHEDVTELAPVPQRADRAAPVPARPAPASSAGQRGAQTQRAPVRARPPGSTPTAPDGEQAAGRPRYPPAPPDQLSFEDSPGEPD